jgi:hypothetical protein
MFAHSLGSKERRLPPPKVRWHGCSSCGASIARTVAKIESETRISPLRETPKVAMIGPSHPTRASALAFLSEIELLFQLPFWVALRSNPRPKGLRRTLEHKTLIYTNCSSTISYGADSQRMFFSNEAPPRPYMMPSDLNRGSLYVHCVFPTNSCAKQVT